MKKGRVEKRSVQARIVMGKGKHLGIEGLQHGLPRGASVDKRERALDYVSIPLTQGRVWEKRKNILQELKSSSEPDQGLRESEELMRMTSFGMDVRMSEVEGSGL